MIDYTAEDQEPSRFDRLLAGAAVVGLLAGTFYWGTWIQRNDQRVREQIAAEKCGERIAFYNAQGLVVCAAGSGRMTGGSRR